MNIIASEQTKKQKPLNNGTKHSLNFLKLLCVYGVGSSQKEITKL